MKRGFFLAAEDDIRALRKEFEEWQEKETDRGWTMLRGVWSAVIPLVPLILVLVMWGAGVNEDRSTGKLEIAHLKKTDERHELQIAEGRKEIIARLDRLAEQIDQLQRQVARVTK